MFLTTRRLIVSSFLGLAVLAGVHVTKTLALQAAVCIPTTGTVSGLTVAQDQNAGNSSLLSMNSGATAPANECSGAAVRGMMWLDTALNAVKNFDGASWLIWGWQDAVNHIWKPVVGGGIEALNSAATTDICSVPGAVVVVSPGGVTAITALGSSCSAPGVMKLLKFAGAMSLTNSSGLILPGSGTINTASGDTAWAFYLGSGNWQVANFNPANGTAITNPSVDVGSVIYSFAQVAPAKYVFGSGQPLTRTSYPDFVAATTRGQSAVRTSGSPTLTGLTDTSGMGAGMPIEGTGIPAGATIASVTPTTIVMAATCSGACNASSSGTATATVFFTGYGTAGSTSTIGVPDCRGAVIAGRDDMNGTAANRLTAVGLGVAGTKLGAFGGSQTATLTLPNLPPYTPTGSVGLVTSAVQYSASSTNAGAAAPGSSGFTSYGYFNGATTSGLPTQAAYNFTGAAQGGTSTPLATVQPTLVANCMIRVLAMIDLPLDIPANDNLNIAINERRSA